VRHAHAAWSGGAVEASRRDTDAVESAAAGYRPALRVARLERRLDLDQLGAELDLVVETPLPSSSTTEAWLYH